MMKFHTKFFVFSVFFLLSTYVFAASYQMKPYPPAEEGYKRMVIHLQPLANEDINKLDGVVN